MIHSMPCRSPCRLYIHHASTCFVSPSSVSEANLDRLRLFHQRECLKYNGHGLLVSCVKWPSDGDNKWESIFSDNCNKNLQLLCEFWPTNPSNVYRSPLRASLHHGPQSRTMEDGLFHGPTSML